MSLPAALGTATYDAANRLTAWDALGPSHDANGQLTSDGTYTYLWNARHELVEVKQGPSAMASYAYDAFGRRTTKTLSEVTTRFASDGPNFVQEQDGAGTPTANLLGGGIDQTFRRTDSAGERFFLTDALGSTVALADGADAITTSYTYEPFGKTTVTGAASANSAQFTGRENDGPLYFYRARYLQPTFGRFISEDPAGFAAGSPNLCAYSRDDPVNVTDPEGRLALRASGPAVPAARLSPTVGGRKDPGVPPPNEVVPWEINLRQECYEAGLVAVPVLVFASAITFAAGAVLLGFSVGTLVGTAGLGAPVSAVEAIVGVYLIGLSLGELALAGWILVNTCP